MPKKKSLSKMTIEVEYSDGFVESCTIVSIEAKKRFYDFVHFAVDIYLDGFREIRLLDSAGRVFRSYCQHY